MCGPGCNVHPGQLYYVLMFDDMIWYSTSPLFFFFSFSQELKEKQQEFESKAMLFNRTGVSSSTDDEPSFKNNTAPLQRKQLTATKTNKQQAVVQPLQGQLEKTEWWINDATGAWIIILLFTYSFT